MKKINILIKHRIKNDAKRISSLNITNPISYSNENNAGGVYGACNDENDPKSEKRDAHAKLYYHEIILRDRKKIIEKLARNSGFDKETAEEAFNHLFIYRHSLNGESKAFDPDYEIAQSIQRLLDGKNIQIHDRLLIGHEAEESRIMRVKKKSYETAHAMANKKYNYEKALDKWESNKR